MGRASKFCFAAAGVGAGLVVQQLWKRPQGWQLAGKVVLITGGSRGLGLALAREFAASGCRVAICARDTEELKRARADLESRGADALALRCDVTDLGQVDGMVGATLEHYGQIDVLVNNAGHIQVGPVQEMTLQDFEQAMDVMFWGVLYPTRAVLPHMIERHSGRIVNITSVGGKVAVPHLLPYDCAKFAATGFSQGLRAELAAEGIKVVTIAPGLMRTGSYRNAWFKGDAEREASWFGVSASLPGITMDGARAARQIVRATERGEAERVLTVSANLLSQFHGLFPGATADILGFINQHVLPAAQPRGRQNHQGNGHAHSTRGADTQAMHSSVLSALMILGRMAARRYLQP
jgi:NAD(P)-dependent dehydrogenase (short-subunit alcohol dehydrogenase family)